MVKRTVRDQMGNIMTINFPGIFHTTPDGPDLEIPLFKCPECNMPVMPSHPTHGGRGYEFVCVNPACWANPDNTREYREHMEKMSVKKSMEDGIKIRKGVWHLEGDGP